MMLANSRRWIAIGVTLVACLLAGASCSSSNARGVGSGGTTSGSGGVSAGGAVATGGMQTTGGTNTGNGGAATTGGSYSVGGSSGSQACGASNYPAACSTSGSPCSIDVSGTARQYYVKLPSSYNASQAYPLVFEFHPGGGTAEMILNDSSYNIRQNFANAIYVIPQGLPSSDGGTDYGWPDTNEQDVNFTKAMLNTLESSYCIDTARIFSAGFSDGGIMSIMLGCQMPDVFRAISVESGFDITGITRGSNCEPSRQIALWQTQGSTDTNVLPADAVAAKDIFLKANHCGRTTTAVDPSPCLSYDGCDSGYPVVWCYIAGEGHAIWTQSGPAIATFFQQF